MKIESKKTISSFLFLGSNVAISSYNSFNFDRFNKNSKMNENMAISTWTIFKDNEYEMRLSNKYSYQFGNQQKNRSSIFFQTKLC